MSRNAEEIQEWTVNYLCKLLDIDKDSIDPSDSFEVYGLDSAAVVGLTGDLSDWLGVEVNPTLAYDYPTIAKLSQALAQDQTAARAREVTAA